MSENERSVFISYRRAVGAAWARAIFADLRARGYDVFMDVESIDSGTFERIIFNQIEARPHFILILTPKSLERCKEHNDMLAREIEHAILLERNIVPLLFDNFSFADQSRYLPPALAALPKYNALAIYHDYFDDGLNKLRERFLKQPMYGAIKPAPRADHAKVLDLLKLSTREATPPSSPTSDWLRQVRFGQQNEPVKPVDSEKQKPAVRWSDLFKQDLPAPKNDPVPQIKAPALPFFLQLNNLDKTLFPSAKPVAKKPFAWDLPAILDQPVTRGYEKPGEFRLNAADIPSQMLEKLEEFLAAGETVKQVAFGADGSWVILRNWCSFWQYGVPQEMSQQLWALFNESAEIAHVALARKSWWVILRDQFHLMPMSLDIPSTLYSKLLELYRTNQKTRCVALSASGGWVVLHGSNGFWTENVPAELLQKMREWSALGHELKQVAFGPGSSFVLLAGDYGYWQQLIPKKMADKLAEYYKERKTIKSVALSPDGGWVILGNWD